MKRTKTSARTPRDLCLIGVFTAIIVVLAQITVPMPYGVPVTLQTFAVPLAGVVLGRKRGMAVAWVYLFLGAVGLPVFSGYAGGFGALFGPTGGFLLSFPLMAWLAGWAGEKGRKLTLTLGLLAGAAVNYLCGMLMYSAVMASDLLTAFTVCVLPFLAADVAKITLAGILGKAIRRTLAKGRVLT